MIDQVAAQAVIQTKILTTTTMTMTIATVIATASAIATATTSEGHQSSTDYLLPGRKK